MKDLVGKRALLTGANGGLGPWLARALAVAGMDVAVSGTSGAELNNVAEEVRSLGRRSAVFPADLRFSEQVSWLAREADAVWGGIDVLINNAGLEYTVPFFRLPEEQMCEVIEVNLTAPLRLTGILINGMIERGWGHVVNMSSLAAKAGPACQEAYAATKAALIAFSLSLRATCRGTGVSASAVCPGFVETGIYARIVQRTGCRAPFLLAPIPPERVAKAVIRAIRCDEAEVLVSKFPVRPILAVMALAPALGLRLVDWLGAHEFFRRVAARLNSPPTDPLG
ncbi:MAG: SDR family NAD(P)-dependent oxidoreductase [Verrucomicrobia bacterium]|nr:SDR family NAD(P)-dependent oxidoreductase [Verrucomicrobiota bacterium]